jgi:hypothetical protein
LNINDELSLLQLIGEFFVFSRKASNLFGQWIDLLGFSASFFWGKPM